MSYSFIHPLLSPVVADFDSQASDFYLYKMSNGVFRRGESSTWYTCREQFHSGLTDFKNIYFACLTNPDLIASMLMRTEMLLNLSPLLFSEVYQCETNGKNQGHLLKIKISPFWQKYQLRQYFLSIVLRAGAQTKKIDDAIVPALMNISYAQSTPRATARFLAGYHCHSIGANSGWVVAMCGYNSFKSLERPKAKPDLEMLYRPGIFSNLTDDDKDKLKKWVKEREVATWSYDKNFKSIPLELD